MERVEIALPRMFRIREQSLNEKQMSSIFFLLSLEVIRLYPTCVFYLFVNTVAKISSNLFVALRPKRYTSCLAASMNPVCLGIGDKIEPHSH